jgi:hypothetical protein
LIVIKQGGSTLGLPSSAISLLPSVWAPVVTERSRYEAAGGHPCTIDEDNASDFGRSFHFAEGPLVY